MKLTGYAAIDYAEANGLTLSKYNDPTEDAREGLTPDEARKVASEDPSLIYAAVPLDGWGIVGEPLPGVIVPGPSGRSIDVTGYHAADYWDGDKFLGPDVFGIVPIYQTADGQFPADAVSYPYLT